MIGARNPKNVGVTLGVVGLMLVGVAGSSASAATTLYENNFEAGWLDFRWTADSRLAQDANIFSTFNGWHSGHTSDFRHTLPAQNLLPGEAIQFTLTFDLYIFDSWDGYSPAGSDEFMVIINNEQKMRDSFSNNPARPQSFREPDMVRANYGGRTSYNDAIYRNITIKFDAPNDSKVRISFRDAGLGGVADESWGIDNFKLAYSVVPSPGAVGLAITGGVLIAARRKRTAS